MEFPSRVAQKLIRLTRSLYSARSDKLLVGWAKGRLRPKIVRGGFDSGLGEGESASEKHARAERSSAGQGYSKGSRLQAIVPAAPFVSNLPFLGRHPLPLPARLVLLCVFNSQLCNQFVAPSLSFPLVSFSFTFYGCFCLSVFFLCFTENFIPLSPIFPFLYQ